MCGIAGLLSASGEPGPAIGPMIASIAHRGPDDDGSWSGPGIVLGHRRLAIVDLSPSGHQPMISNDGRHVLSFNGEIYNHVALRVELEAAGGGPAEGGWRSPGDTETLLEAIAFWGLEVALQRCVGMFALAAYDRETGELKLARDRFGEKPLYFGWVGGDFAFASELKAIRTLSGFRNPVSRAALRLLLARSYIAAPLSIYEDIYKLEPGCILTMTRGAAAAAPVEAPSAENAGADFGIERYWSYRDVVTAGLASPISDENEALERLEQVLATAIGGQAVADVPVGAFLSGGIDSSTIVALYRKYAPGAVRTFTIGFEDPAFNEAPTARVIAAHLGTEHHERIVTVAETREVIPLLPAMYDEPFADSSQIPTHLVAAFAREQVTVALSGDAGDELFGGYNRYVGASRLWAGLEAIPAMVRSGVAGTAGRLPPSAWQKLGQALPGLRQPYFGTKVQKALRTIGAARGLEDVYTSFLDEWAGEPSPVLDDGRVGAPRADMRLDTAAPEVVRMMYWDAISYLPDDILCKVDRAAMAVSLETRVPFLDHRVAELAARIPADMKVRGKEGKWILRRLLEREVPKGLFDRPKTGFGIPVGEWLKGPLRPWAEELLDEARLRREGFFDAPRIRARWADHLAGRRDSTQALWTVLMFQSWYAAQPDAARALPEHRPAPAARAA